MSNDFIVRTQASDVLKIKLSGSIIPVGSIHYDTTANWNAKAELIGQKDHIYIYSDYTQKDGENVPAIKAGDGVTLLINTPFTTVDLSEIETALEGKVDKETGKGLSTNDFTDALKDKLDGIESGAQVNTVTGVKGGAEADYRTGNIDITKANIGLGNVDNTSDADKPVSTAVQTALNGKVDKETGKGLSTNDFTDALKTKLDGIETGAEANVQPDWNQTDTTADDYIKNKPSVTGAEWGSITGTLSNQADLKTALDGKVNTETGKGLSTEDFTTAEKTKLSGIETGAEVNVQANWNEADSTSDAFIQNKPSIPAKTSDLQNDSGFITGVSWGAIGGNLADQTDLNNELTALNTGLSSVDFKVDDLAETVLNAPTTDWGIIQKQVEAGLAAELYPVGTQFTIHHDVYGDMLFDVIGHDHDLPAGKDHSMTLLMHNVIYSTQFDEVEGFYYCENGLTAGTYNVTITRQPWFAGDVGKTFQFTLASDVPAGAILWWDGYNATREGRTVRVYNTRGATSASQTATMTEGNGGTSLGNIDGTGNCNFFDRTVLGSNDWEESGVRQWLNADTASDWWEPKTKWDRLVSYYSRPGFLYGLDADFKNVLVETTHGNRSNTVYDSHGTNVAYNTTEKIFLLCNEEVNLAQEQGIVCGTVYDYYKDAANADRIKYDITSTGTARYWWLRSPRPSTADYERIVLTSGALDYYHAGIGSGVAAACVIAGNGSSSSKSVLGLINDNASAINALSESVAPIETGTASQPYAVGAYMLLNGQFCIVTAAIATGETITVGTNVAETSVGKEIELVSSNIAKGVAKAEFFGFTSSNTIDITRTSAQQVYYAIIRGSNGSTYYVGLISSYGGGSSRNTITTLTKGSQVNAPSFLSSDASDYTLHFTFGESVSSTVRVLVIPMFNDDAFTITKA